MRDYVRTGRWEAAGDRGTRSLQGRAPLQVGGGALEGAYVEHELHGRDAGGVEIHRLVERRRGLPVSKRGHTVWDEGAGQLTGVQRAVQGRARLQIEGRARGRAHREHLAHVRDAGGIEA